MARSNYTIHLMPLNEDEAANVEALAVVLDDVEIGTNQLGWLIATDSKREIVAIFTPGSVRFAQREEDLIDDAMSLTTIVDDEELVN